PTEGTILTVMREATDYAEAGLTASSTVEGVLTDFLKEAKASLKRTPDLLPVLKKAGVIDSGAQGLIYVVEGFRKCVRGEDDGTYEEVEAESPKKLFGPDSKLEYGYCTEFILQLMNYETDIPSFDLKTITDYLETIGDSIVAIKDEDVVKIHVHTMTPAKAIEFCQKYGEFTSFKMENMSVQHSETDFAKGEEEVAIADSAECEKAKYGVVAVCTGDKLSETFTEMGVDRIIRGGQTMNPSSEDFIKAFQTLSAENILVFPNNSNVYLAAKQAADMYDKSHVIVLNTSTIAEGYAALTMLDTSIEDPERLKKELEAAAANVETVQVTYAVRDGAMDGVEFKKGDYIGVAGKTMLSASEDKIPAAAKAVCGLADIKEREIITVIYGADVSDEEKTALKAEIENALPHVEIYEIDGGQEVYSFVIAVE
ncbi:MAG: DAK2 domain-containing protein, partial [Clostridia bacterium]|nr:DAK2 domain-containing protein [Clostridia bacterium]